MPLSPQVSQQLLVFHRDSKFVERGAIVTDLDGTAVHENEGRVYVAETVVEGLKALVDLGRPVILNTLRFPLNVIHTFGHAWSAISAAPLPLVSLNGSVIGLLTPTDAGETTFVETVAFPIAIRELEKVTVDLEALLQDGVDDIILFHYPRDWREGEFIWTPRPERIDALRAKYRSASQVKSTTVSELRDDLLKHGATMLSLVVDIPEDRRMAYQQADPNRFITATGVDKLSGAGEAAAWFDFDLDQSIGAGDTAMDNFLNGVGLAVQVGKRTLEFRGLFDTVRVRDPFELGMALFELASLRATQSRERS